MTDTKTTHGPVPTNDNTNTATQPTAQLPSIPLSQRKQQWELMAVKIHTIEQSLQLQCSAMVAQLATVPATVEELPEAETKIKNIKSALIERIEERKTVTEIFRKVANRLMGPEKSVETAIAAYDSAILSLKKIQAAENAKVTARNDEIARFREAYSSHIANQHAAFESRINAKVMDLFERALNGGIAPDAIPMDAMNAVYTVDSFATVPTGTTTGKVYLNDDEVIAIWMELKEKQAKPAAEYLAQYHTALMDRFAFYDVSLKNKEASLAAAKETAAAEEAWIATEKANAGVAAKLETLAVPMAPTIATSGKQIKTIYVLDMEENENNALIILTAFASNWQLCKGKIRAAIWNVSIKQMGAALEAVKNNDEKFEVSGVKFKKEDKL